MIENFDRDNYIVTVNGERFYLKHDLEAVAEATGRQKTYLRKPTKIKVYKELKDRYPDVYEEISKYYWFDKESVEGVTTPVENESIEKEEDVSMNTELVNNLLETIKEMNEERKRDDERRREQENINNETIKELSKSIESISDKHRIEYAEDKITDFIHEFVKKEYGNLPKTLDIRVTDDKTIKVEGLTHKIFPKVLKLVNMGKAIMLTGPAGTGKNFLIEQIANALDGKFFYSSTITQEYKLTGFIDASGNYHSTELRKAIDYANENPNTKVIMMIDEIDASIPDTLVVVNSLLANGYFDFPDQRVSVGKNFVVIAAGNTVGLGADMVYTGRNVIDGATLDRFILVKMDYDTELENALCPEESLKNFIYDIRRSAKKNKVNCIVGMRCLKNAYEMFVNDFDKQDIVSDSIIKGLGEDDINILKADLDSSNEWYKYFKYVA